MPYLLKLDESGNVTFEFEKSTPIYRKGKGKSLIELPNNYVCIDLETTGFSPQYDEIIEIAAFKVKDREIIDKFYTLVKPSFEIDSYIQELTHITNEMLENAPAIEAVLHLLIEFISDEVLVGHNVSFDVNFIYDNYLKIFNECFSNNYVDTMRLSKKLYPELPHHRLKDLIKLFDVKIEGAHRAFYDAGATMICFEHLRDAVIKKFGSEEEFKKLFSCKSKRKSLDDISAECENFDINNPFYQKNVVFTGTLERMTRREAAQVVVNLGGLCENGVTKKTDFLILGNNDYCKSIKDGKSSKQKKAESLILKGSDLKIIPESVFYDLLFEWKEEK